MLFFIALIAVVTSTTTAPFPLQKLLANPKLFAAAFANADNEAVNKMIALTVELIAEGQAAKEWANNDHSAKTDTHNADVATLEGAESALATASGNLDVASTRRDGLVALESDHRSALDAAVGVLNDATAHEALTNAHWEATSTRVAEEKTSFGQIKELLEGVKSAPAERRLLDVADPAAVDVIIAKIDDLLAVGAQELADSTADHDAAVTALASATDSEAAARALHTNTAGQLAAAENSVKELSAIKKTKLSERDSASDAEAHSRDVLANALSFKEAETARVDKEDATLKEVKGLLENVNA